MIVIVLVRSKKLILNAHIAAKSLKRAPSVSDGGESTPLRERAALCLMMRVWVSSGIEGAGRSFSM